MVTSSMAPWQPYPRWVLCVLVCKIPLYCLRALHVIREGRIGGSLGFLARKCFQTEFLSQNKVGKNWCFFAWSPKSCVKLSSHSNVQVTESSEVSTVQKSFPFCGGKFGVLEQGCLEGIPFVSKSRPNPMERKKRIKYTSVYNIPINPKYHKGIWTS